MPTGDPRPDDAYVWDDSLGWVMKHSLLDYAVPGHVPKMDSEGQLLHATWKPIETAPKTGKPVLGYSTENVSYVCWWDGKGWCFHKNYRGDRLYFEPTHWMLLPRYPITSNGGEDVQEN